MSNATQNFPLTSTDKQVTNKTAPLSSQSDTESHTQELHTVPTVTLSDKNILNTLSPSDTNIANKTQDTTITTYSCTAAITTPIKDDPEITFKTKKPVNSTKPNHTKRQNHSNRIKNRSVNTKNNRLYTNTSNCIKF